MVLSVGEILADMIGCERDGLMRYERYAGGAPFNVACGIRRFGGKSGFIGAVGDDVVGDWLCAFAEERGFSQLSIRKDPSRNTTLAFVELDANGERSFCFYRKGTADYFLNEDYDEYILRSDIVHIGSLMLSEPEGRAAADRLFDAARRYGKRISFDMNYRDDLFSSPEAFLPYIERADIVKLSEEELKMLAGEDSEAGAIRLTGDRLLAVTLGGKGSAFCHRGVFRTIPSIAVTPVDTTGAGDAFYAGLLTCLDTMRFSSLDDLAYAFRFANVCGALTTTQKGAIAALPTAETVRSYLR